MPPIPIINLEFSELKEIVWTKLQEPKSQRKLVLVIVSIALLLDNMLYMVIVPIIPDYLRYIGAYSDDPLPENSTLPPGTPFKHDHHGQDSATGILFASKAIVQLMVNPFSGALIDRIGYDIPMMIGLCIMFLSTAVFACGRSYGLLFFARSLQGVGSAFADTAGLAMIADRFTEENERSQALGIALAFISFGCLVAPPFGGALYQFAGKEVPFLILAFVSLIDGFMLLIVMKPIKEQLKEAAVVKPPSVPIWKLFMDPYIAVCSGALMMANVALAFLEPTISLWMEDNLTTDNWKIGMVWLPAFIPHVVGVVITVKMAKKYPHYQWFMAALGLALEGLCCFIIPFSTSYVALMIPICGICFGVALVDTAILPTLGYLVDVRYVSVYGSIYAIADISYSVAYAVGPIIAGGVVEAIGFTALNVGIAISNLAYVPVMSYLKHIYDFKPMENEANILMSDPPNKEYQTYVLQEQKNVNDVQNHLEYKQQEETNFNSHETYQEGFPANAPNYPDPSPQPRPQGQGRVLPQQPVNPFRPQAPAQPPMSTGGNPFRQGLIDLVYNDVSINSIIMIIISLIRTKSPIHVQLDTEQIISTRIRKVVNVIDVVHSVAKSADHVFFRTVPENGFKKRKSSLRNRQNTKLPIRSQRWRQSLLSLPKKLLSSTSLVHSHLGGVVKEDVALPKLPIPPLEATMQKYLKTLQPLLSDQDHDRVRKIVEKFSSEGGLGRKLQLYLLDRRDKTDNWAYEYWLNDLYLNYREPIPINSNPGMVFPPRKFTTILDVARFTARLIDAALSHKDILNRKGLPIERATSREPGQPLCMAQYYRILSCCRLPGKVRDAQLIADYDEQTHVIVICRNQQYCVPVQARDRGRLNEDEICAQLLYILDDAPCHTDTAPVGILTAWKRPLWAEARQDLMREEQNLRNLDLIASSLLVVCLDEALPSTFNCRLHRGGKGYSTGDRDESNLAHQMIHGGGSHHNSANRWFDKTVQIVVSNDGGCGLCYEHSMAEGVAVIQLMEALWKHADSLPPSDVPSVKGGHLPPPEKLHWILEATDLKRIEDAADVMDNLVKDLDFQVYRFTGYGKEFIKSRKVSPDVYIQLALQLAYYKLYGRLSATYESASTRRFLQGRVDCIRSATIEALQWVKAMTQPKEDTDYDIGNKKVTFHLVSDDEKYDLWHKAVQTQTQEMVDNILGQGIDVHLLGLREAARDTCPTATSPLPELFTDPSYRLANKFLLSTSQVATSTGSFMGYGPVEPDGYGAAYDPKTDHIVFCLSAFWSSEVTSTSKFAQSLEESLNAMQVLLTRP